MAHTGEKVTYYFSGHRTGEDVTWRSKHRLKGNIETFIRETVHA